MTRVPRTWYPLADADLATTNAVKPVAKGVSKPGPIDPLSGPKLALAVKAQ